MKKVMVGKFIPGNSFMHHMNPLLKLILNILIIVIVSMTSNLLLIGIIAVFSITAYLVSGLSKWGLFKTINTAVFIGIFVFAINLFFVDTDFDITKGELMPDNLVIYASFGKLNVTNTAIKLTVVIMMRIYIMILATTVLTATTAPLSLTRAFEDFLTPLKIFFIPTHVIAQIISIALRFIPTLLEEAQRIMKAQSSRGVDFHNGNLKQKGKSILTLVIPLFVSAFAKADDLANAMETRGYSPYAKRTRYTVFPWKWQDIVTVVLIVGMLSLVILTMVDANIDIPNFDVPDWNVFMPGDKITIIEFVPVQNMQMFM